MFHRFTSPFREFGFISGLIYLIDSALTRISTDLRLIYYEIYVQPIPDKPIIPERMAQQFEIREIKPGDTDLDLMPAFSHIKKYRFEQNSICLGAYVHNKLIGYIWFCFHAYKEDEVRCTFLLAPEEESVFDFDLYIFPEYRMGLGFMGIWNGANEYLRDKGIKYSFSRVTKFNLGSRRAHEQLGSKHIASAVILKLRKFEFILTTIYPYINFSIRESRRVKLKLNPDRNVLLS